jgi:hypothetical protein
MKYESRLYEFWPETRAYFCFLKSEEGGKIMSYHEYMIYGTTVNAEE